MKTGRVLSDSVFMSTSILAFCLSSKAAHCRTLTQATLAGTDILHIQQKVIDSHDMECFRLSWLETSTL